MRRKRDQWAGCTDDDPGITNSSLCTGQTREVCQADVIKCSRVLWMSGHTPAFRGAEDVRNLKAKYSEQFITRVPFRFMKEKKCIG